MELTIKDFGEIIKRSRAIILSVIIAATALGYILSVYILPKEYEATAMMVVSTSFPNRNNETTMTEDDYNLNAKLVNSYSVICKSDRVLSQVRDRLAINIELDELSKKIAVTSKEGTDIISISSRDPSPRMAQSITNTLVDVFKTEVAAIMRMNNVQVIDYAALPYKPAWPSVSLTTAAAGMIGLVIALIAAVLRFSSDDTVKDVDFISEIMEAPVIGSVPRLE